MNIIALLIIAFGAVLILIDAATPKPNPPRRWVLWLVGLVIVIIGFMLAFVIQVPWGHGVAR